MARKSALVVRLEALLAAKDADLSAVNHRLTVANTRIEELETALQQTELPQRVTAPIERVAQNTLPTDTIECTKCGGTGLYRDQYMCYGCRGTGKQTVADQKRNWGYNKSREEGRAGPPVVAEAEFRVASEEARKLALEGRKPRVVRNSETGRFNVYA